MFGDNILFQRADSVEAGWRAVQLWAARCVRPIEARWAQLAETVTQFSGRFAANLHF